MCDSTAITEAHAIAIRPRVTEPLVWVCLYYETDLSNKSTPSQKENAWEFFQGQCEEDLKNTNLNSFTYLSRPGKGDYRNKLVKAAKGWNEDNNTFPDVLEPRWEPFAERTYPQAGLTILIFILGAGMWWGMIYFKSFDTAALDKFMNEQNT